MTERDVHLSPAETADRMGVTVRALRVYERHGLLKPLRSLKNWRAYGPAEIARLHQILALKQLGLSLARIGELLSGRFAHLDDVLALQEEAARRRKDDAERALSLLAAARARLAAGEALSVDALTTLTRETTVTKKLTDEEWTEIFEPLWKKHFSADELAKVTARKFEGAELAGWDQEKVGKAWEAVIAEARALMAKGNPDAPEVADLVRRWKQLQDLFTGGDPQVAEKTAAMWREAMANPSTAPRLPMSADVFAFVAEAAKRLKEREGAR